MATKLGKRPHPKNYAMYDPRGKAKYRKDLAEYKDKKKKIEAEKGSLEKETGMEWYIRTSDPETIEYSARPAKKK